VPEARVLPYEGGDLGETVGNTSRYASNHGAPANKSDVIVYARRGYKGAADCIVEGDKARLPRNWWNTIESYRWVTRTACAKAGIIRLD
jgi:hypothetical protein